MHYLKNTIFASSLIVSSASLCFGDDNPVSPAVHDILVVSSTSISLPSLQKKTSEEIENSEAHKKILLRFHQEVRVQKVNSLFLEQEVGENPFILDGHYILPHIKKERVSFFRALRISDMTLIEIPILYKEICTAIHGNSFVFKNKEDRYFVVDIGNNTILGTQSIFQEIQSEGEESVFREIELTLMNPGSFQEFIGIVLRDLEVPHLGDIALENETPKTKVYNSHSLKSVMIFIHKNREYFTQIAQRSIQESTVVALYYDIFLFSFHNSLEIYERTDGNISGIHGFLELYQRFMDISASSVTESEFMELIKTFNDGMYRNKTFLHIAGKFKKNIEEK